MASNLLKLCALAVALGGCAQPAVPPSGAPALLKPRVLYSGLHCGREDPRPALGWISDSQTLDSTYQRLNQHWVGGSSPQPPALDFNRAGLTTRR